MSAVLRWWPRSEPIPAGWRLAPHQVASHHHAYSVLIIKVAP